MMADLQLKGAAAVREADQGLLLPTLLSEALHQLQEPGRTVFEIETSLKTPAAVGSDGGAFGIIKTAPGSEKVDRAGEGVRFDKTRAIVLYLSPYVYLGRDQDW